MKTWQRILLFIGVYVLVLVLPWWLSSLIIIGLTLYIPFYFEILFFGFLFDILYSTKFSGNFFHNGLLFSTVFLLVVIFVKTKIRT